MFGYIYLTENLVNYKCYIGKRQQSKFDKSYLGSGTLLKKAIKKYGKNNFICQPIQWCETEDELLAAEAYWVDKCNAVVDEMFYNRIPGGGKNADMKGDKNPFANRTHTEESKEAMRKSKQELVASGWHPANYGVTGENNPLTGMHYHTDEFKEQLAERNRNWVRTEDYKNKMSESQKKRLSDPKARQRISEANSVKVICYYNGELYMTFNSVKEAKQYFGVTYLGHSKLKDYLFVKEG